MSYNPHCGCYPGYTCVGCSIEEEREQDAAGEAEQRRIMERAEYINAMLDLLGKLESNPELPLPHHGNNGTEIIFTWSRREYEVSVDAFGGMAAGSEIQDPDGTLRFRPSGRLNIVVYLMPKATPQMQMATLEEIPI